jgi:hypothetical protein
LLELASLSIIALPLLLCAPRLTAVQSLVLSLESNGIQSNGATKGVLAKAPAA